MLPVQFYPSDVESWKDLQQSWRLGFSSVTMEGGDAALRLFRVSVDVRSFKAGVRMPMRTANVFVKVVLPPQIVKLALESPHLGNAAKLTAPLRSHPPILVERSTEVAIPNGYVALELPASVLGLAATLAQDPQLVAEVYHRDRYAADSIIGTAHIPMAPLMHEPCLDGYAPVRTERGAEQISTGSLRVVLAAEELGPVAGLHKKRTETGGVPSAYQTPGLEESFLLLKNNISQLLGSKAVAVQTEQQNAAAEAAPKSNASKEIGKEMNFAKNEKASVSFQMDCTENGNATTRDAGATNGLTRISKDDELRDHTEYELAWEFEMWRRTEEAKWRADLREKEIATLKALEEESKKREMERTLAIDKVRIDLANLESKLRAKLLAVEKRERALVLAEEESSLRREALERQCAQRLADAEGAVKRLQVGCEHRLELEHAKYRMLQEQYATIEQRLANTNEALASIEKEFTAYKATQRSSSETELGAQILVLKHQCLDLERKAEAATRARNDYKAQVLRLAKELAAYRKRSQDIAGCDNAALASLIEARAEKANEERLELKHLKEQVERLQIQEQTALAAASAATAAAVATAAVSRQVPEAPKDPKTDICAPANHAEGNKNDAANLGANQNTEGKNEMHEKFGEHEHQRRASPEQADVRTSDRAGPQHIRRGSLEQADTRSLDSFLNDHKPAFDDTEPFLSRISAFQKAEILRLTKQKADLLQTGVYTLNDRIIKGLDQEIRRLQSVDTRAFI